MEYNIFGRNVYRLNEYDHMWSADENHELLKDDKTSEVRKAHFPNTSVAPTPEISV
jgi:hypothetical protein